MSRRMSVVLESIRCFGEQLEQIHHAQVKIDVDEFLAILWNMNRQGFMAPSTRSWTPCMNAVRVGRCWIKFDN